MTVALVAVAMAVGLVGTVVPAVPGLVLVWGAALVYGMTEGFGAVGVAAFVVVTALAVAGIAAGIVLPGRAAGTAGAARSSLLLGAALGVVGFFVVPIVGFPLGGALGIWAGERLRTGDARVAWRATVATLKAFGLAAVAQLAAGLAMVATWVVWGGPRDPPPPPPPTTVQVTAGPAPPCTPAGGTSRCGCASARWRTPGSTR